MMRRRCDLGRGVKKSAFLGAWRSRASASSCFCRSLFLSWCWAGRPGLPSAAEAWVELVLPALRLPASCPGREASFFYPGRELVSAVCTLLLGRWCFRGLCCRYGLREDEALGPQCLQEEAGSKAGVVVLPSSRARPLKETSSEVDSDEFFDDQTPRPVPRQGVAVVHGPPRRPPKPMKKPGGEGQAGGEGEGSEGLGLEAVAAATWAEG